MTAILASINRVTRALLKNDEEQQALSLIAEGVCSIVGCGSSFVALRDIAGEFHVRATHGLDETARRTLFRHEPLSGAQFQALWAAGWIDGTNGTIEIDHPVFRELERKNAVKVLRRIVAPHLLLLVPLLDADGVPLGFLCGGVPDEQRLTADVSAALSIMADLAVVVINAAQQRGLDRSRAYMEDGIFRAAADIRTSLDLDGVLSDIARGMTATSGFARVSISLLSEDGVLHTRATSGVSEADDARLRDNPIPLTALAPFMQPQMRVSRSYLFNHQFFDIPPALLELSSVPPKRALRAGRWSELDSMTLPLIDEAGTTLGIISADEPVSGEFPDLAHIRALEFFADQAAKAIVQARRHERLQQQALTDALTGIANRQAFLDALDGAVHHTGRSSDGEISVLFCDVDEFKAVNDTHGHVAGDQALRAVAGALADALRPGDVVGRYGGDEFVVLMHDAPESEARLVGDRLRRRVADLCEPMLPAGLQVSISVGVATRERSADSDPKQTAKALIFEADRALYVAKSAGRNQVR